MYELIEKSLAVLAPWPIIQTAAAVLVVYAGIKAMNRGEKDRKAPDDKPRQDAPNNNPSEWTMETLISIGHDVEEIRRAVDANTKAISDLTLQVNHIAYLFERKP